MSFLCIKAELFKWFRGIDRASHTKKDGVKDNFFGQALLSRDLQFHVLILPT